MKLIPSALSVIGLGLWAFAPAHASTTVFFQGTLSATPLLTAPDPASLQPGVDAAILNLLGGATVTGQFTLDLSVPGTNLGLGDVRYDFAVPSVQMVIDGFDFPESDSDPTTCAVSGAFQCSVRVVNDTASSRPGDAFDSYSLLSDGMTGDALTREVERLSGFTPVTPFFVPNILASLGLFAIGEGIVDSTDLISPLGLNAPAAGLSGAPGLGVDFFVPEAFAVQTETGSFFSRYGFAVEGLVLSETAIAPPTPAVIPLPASAWTLLGGLLGMAALRRRRIRT